MFAALLAIGADAPPEALDPAASRTRIVVSRTGPLLPLENVSWDQLGRPNGEYAARGGPHEQAELVRRLLGDVLGVVITGSDSGRLARDQHRPLWELSCNSECIKPDLPLPSKLEGQGQLLVFSL
jgi:hypothetical protein